MHDATTTAIGTKHGRLTIIEELGRYVNDSGRGRGLVKCQCDCGKQITISRKRIYIAEYQGVTLNCGCIKRERSAQAKAKAEAKRAEMRILAEKRKAERLAELEKTKYERNIRRCLLGRLGGMIRRCNDPKCTRFQNYGGKGVKVCEEWRTDKEAFVKWALDNGFKPELEIDRIDDDGDYCPYNCRWISRHDNIARRDSTKRKGATVLEWNGERMTAREWERKLGLKRSVIGWRLRHGFNTHDALFGRVG